MHIYSNGKSKKKKRNKTNKLEFVEEIALTCGRSFGSIKMLEMTRNETALNCVTVAKTVLASFLSRRDHVAPKH